MRVVVVPFGDERYAVGTDQVREVATDLRMTPLPGAPAWVLGVFNLRGEVMPLLDTADLLGLPSQEASSFAVVVQTSSGSAALTTTGPPEVTTVDDNLEPSDVTGALGRLRVGDALVVVLDVEALLAEVRAEPTGIAGGAR